MQKQAKMSSSVRLPCYRIGSAERQEVNGWNAHESLIGIVKRKNGALIITKTGAYDANSANLAFQSSHQPPKLSLNTIRLRLSPRVSSLPALAYSRNSINYATLPIATDYICWLIIDTIFLLDSVSVGRGLGLVVPFWSRSFVDGLYVHASCAESSGDLIEETIKRPEINLFIRENRSKSEKYKIIGKILKPLGYYYFV